VVGVVEERSSTTWWRGVDEGMADMVAQQQRRRCGHRTWTSEEGLWAPDRRAEEESWPTRLAMGGILRRRRWGA
jgi:hypothetical protein